MPQFLIANILVRIDYAGVPVLSEGNLQRFLYTGDWAGDTVELKCASEDLSEYRAHQVMRDNRVFGIYSHQSEKLLIYHWGRLFHGFAVWPDRFAVTFDPQMYAQTPLREDWFFSVCAFHRQLLTRNGCVFHASFLDVGGEAVLFTGPSGIGKSTQAGLWVDFESAEVVNGDRAALRRVNGRWTAFGFPASGTSGICRNRNLPLKAIVVLEQGSENRVDELPASAKIRALVSATELYPWDGDEIEMAISVAQDIVTDVPVIKLSCRPDRDAVKVLKAYLEEKYGSV